MATEKKVPTAKSKEVKAAPKKATADKVIQAKKVAKPKAEKFVAQPKKPAVVPTKKSEKSGKTVKVQQIASGAGRLKSQIQTLKGLNLNKINKVSELEDTPSIQGMINKVKHLIKVLSN